MTDIITKRLWEKDSSLWSKDPLIQKTIQNRLGWLDTPTTFNFRIEDIVRFEKTIPYSYVVLLGMGGSSLIADVYLRYTKPIKREFYILDTTDANRITTVCDQIDLEDTLFIVASKSGTTLEVDSLFDFFWDKCPNPNQFIAITDAGTPLEQKAKELRFRKTWINPTNIGGRFAAHSYFGLIPFALMGHDLHTYWNRLLQSISVFHEDGNSAWVLADSLWRSYQKGMDKLCLQANEPVSCFSDWVEQLVAESTGKDEKGLLPVLQTKGEPTGHDCYVHTFGKTPSSDFASNSTSLISDIYDLGYECFFWQMVVSYFAHFLDINPFDEPHVVSTKTKTRAYLDHDNPTLAIAKKLETTSQSFNNTSSFLKDIQRPEWIAILSYLPQNQESHLFIQKMKKEIKESHDVSICIGEGPRYLHSTGQFHKGASNQGRFIILTQNQPPLPIPNQPFDFNTLKLAQALGDYEALEQANRKVMLIHL